MPGARTHDTITVVTGLALVPLAYVTLLGQGHSPAVTGVDTGLLVGAHLLSGIMFSPDLDIDSAIDNRWWIFWWIWRPYMWAVPHRSLWLSHGLIIPPLLRLLYFFTVITLLFFSLAWVLGQISMALCVHCVLVVPNYPMQALDYLIGLIDTQPRRVLLFLIGFITGGAAHTIADWLVTGGKHILRRLGFRPTHDYTGHDQRRHYHRQRHTRWG